MQQAIMKHEAKVIQDLPGKTIIVTREFNAPPEKVWRAFTEPALLDKWWAPKPWKIETKALDFRPGGIWHFCMFGEDGLRFWWRVDYEAIEPLRSIIATGGACDENAVLPPNTPPMRRLTEFAATPTGTLVTITITFEKESDLRFMVERGMLAGTTAVFDNLDELLGSNAL